MWQRKVKLKKRNEPEHWSRALRRGPNSFTNQEEIEQSKRRGKEAQRLIDGEADPRKKRTQKKKKAVATKKKGENTLTAGKRGQAVVIIEKNSRVKQKKRGLAGLRHRWKRQLIPSITDRRTEKRRKKYSGSSQTISEEKKTNAWGRKVVQGSKNNRSDTGKCPKSRGENKNNKQQEEKEIEKASE